MEHQLSKQPTPNEPLDNSKNNKSKITCPRCGKIYWLSPGERITCKNPSNSPYASNGICFLTLEGPMLKNYQNNEVAGSKQESV